MRPLFVELAGLPAAGKTSGASSLHQQLPNSVVSSQILPESARRSPLNALKEEWVFNVWTLCETVQRVIEARNERAWDVVILDRGLIDALCWIEWHRRSKQIATHTASVLENFVCIPEWFDELSYVAILVTTWESASRRRNAKGRIMNQEVFSELNEVYRDVSAELTDSPLFKGTIRLIETDALDKRAIVRTLADDVLQLASTRWS